MCWEYNRHAQHEHLASGEMTACDADDLPVDYVVIEDREILYPSEKRIPLIADNWDCSPPASELILVVGDELIKSLVVGLNQIVDVIFAIPVRETLVKILVSELLHVC